MRPSVERSSGREALPLDIIARARLVARAIGSRVVCVTIGIGAIGGLDGLIGRHVVWCCVAFRCVVIAVDRFRITPVDGRTRDACLRIVSGWMGGIGKKLEEEVEGRKVAGRPSLGYAKE